MSTSKDTPGPLASPSRGHGDGAVLDEAAREWLRAQGILPQDEALWAEALTHGSMASGRDYQRLEFLGDRVLALVMAEWLHARSDDSEGKLSQRLNALVSRATCAQVARAIGLAPHIRLGKQALEDGGRDSPNILGDVIEALLGACFLEQGYDAARARAREWWGPIVESDAGRRKHPKSALQEWAAGNRRAPPEYELVERSGPDHAARFTVRVRVPHVGEAEASASSKQEAERRAAAAFLDRYG